LEQRAKDNTKEENYENFRDKKVFVADSAGIFWGNSMMLSKNGERVMAILADFIKQVPNNIIISERPVQNNDKNFNIGQERAWSVIDYLCKKYGISYDRFMISSSGTIDNISSDRENGRMVEIVLLERSFAN
jgi:flagellar motor protein MotB